MVVFVKIEQIGTVEFKTFHEWVYKENTIRMILILLPGSGSLIEHIAKCRQHFNGIDPPQCDFLPAFNQDRLLSASAFSLRLHEFITAAIKQTPHSMSLQSVGLHQKDSHMFDVDEDISPALNEAKESVNRAFQSVTVFSQTDLLPLQEHWLEFVFFSKMAGQQVDQNSAECKNINDSMVHCRTKLLQTLRGNTFMQDFLRELEESYASPLKDRLVCYVEYVQELLNERSRKTLPELNKNYARIYNRLCDKETTERERMLLQNSLASAEQKLTETLFDVHFIFREMGHIYEALNSEALWGNQKFAEIFSNHKSYPKLMASIFLSGFPLEIMDGDASGIPLTWLVAVLDCVREEIEEQSLVVVSVLGVQSSGKSTLLNAMFGADFTVGVGRCTRGVYGQLLPVQREGVQDWKFDYIFLLDTEGIRALEHSKGSIQRYNEIATLVIGLSDLIIMNVKGEQFSDLQDVIQIAIHAFLRMHMQNLDRRCIFIHQNITATDVKDKLAVRRTKWVESLNKATQEAAFLENIYDIEEFKQIVNFDAEKHIFYIGDIWLGHPPMAPTNPTYNEGVKQVKRFLLIYLQNEIDVRNISQFSDNLEKFTESWKIGFQP